MKVYYQGIMNWLNDEIEKDKFKGYDLMPRDVVLMDVRDNINRIIKEEHQKIMKETDEKIWDAR